MAYRQLCALTLVASWLAACGGGGTLPAPSTNDSDAIPANTDQPPGSSDQAPANEDQPPQASQSSGGTAKPGGSNECKDFCDDHGKSCAGDNQANTIIRSLCDRGCDSLLGNQQCAPAFGKLLTCVVALPGLCTPMGPSGSDLQKCTEVYQTWTTCDGDKSQGNPPAMQPAGCKKDAGCDCADECASCHCLLGESSATCAPLCQ